MTADFALVMDAAQSHAHVFTAGGFGNRLAKRGFAHAGRAHQAQNRTFELVHAFLHRQVFQNALFHLFQAIVVGIKHQVGLHNIFANLAFLLPRNVYQRFDIIPHHGRLGRHRRHHAQLFHFAQRFFFRFLAHAGFAHLLFELVELFTLVTLAQLFLNRFYLLVQIIVALGFFHLPFHPAADAFFHLQNIQLGFQLAEQVFHTFGHVGDFQNLLALLQLELQVGGNGVHQAAVVGDAVNGAGYFAGDFLVELDELVELRQKRAAQGFVVVAIGVFFGSQHFNFGLEIIAAVVHVQCAGTLHAFHQHFHRTVGQFQHLQDIGQRADSVQIVCAGVFVGRIFLRQKEHRPVLLDGGIQRGNGFGAANKQRQHHMWIHHHVTQRQHRQGAGFSGIMLGLGHYLLGYCFQLNRMAKASLPGKLGAGKRISSIQRSLVCKRLPENRQRFESC